MWRGTVYADAPSRSTPPYSGERAGSEGRAEKSGFSQSGPSPAAGRKKANRCFNSALCTSHFALNPPCPGPSVSSSLTCCLACRSAFRGTVVFRWGGAEPWVVGGLVHHPQRSRRGCGWLGSFGDWVRSGLAVGTAAGPVRVFLRACRDGLRFGSSTRQPRASAHLFRPGAGRRIDHRPGSAFAQPHPPRRPRDQRREGPRAADADIGSRRVHPNRVYRCTRATVIWMIVQRICGAGSGRGIREEGR